MVADNFQPSQPQENNNLQVGYALNRREEGDSAWSQAMNAEATRLWARFFSSGNTSHLHISVPADWANFFTMQLLASESFMSTKQLLSSKIPSLLSSYDCGTIEFFIPNSCPGNSFACLAASDEESQGLGTKTSKEVPPKKRQLKRSTAIVESEVRSPRLKNSSQGFKLRVCTDKKCLACGTKSPTLKKEIIKKLAMGFCKLDESEFNDNLLQLKKVKGTRWLEQGLCHKAQLHHKKELLSRNQRRLTGMLEDRRREPQKEQSRP